MPRSTTRPAFRTRISSASATVESRCATIKVVRPERARRNVDDDREDRAEHVALDQTEQDALTDRADHEDAEEDRKIGQPDEQRTAQPDAAKDPTKSG